MHPASRKQREKIASGRPVFGMMTVEFTGAAVVTATANAGCDVTIVDGEHGNQDPRGAEMIIEAGWQAGLCALMRPPDTNRVVITRSLDAGAGSGATPCSPARLRHGGQSAHTKYQEAKEFGKRP